MRLPSTTSSYEAYTRYGRYVARRLRRAGLEALAKDAEKVTLAVRTSGRAWEDADDPIQDALADRDSADDALDLTAQTLRNSLAGQGVGSDRRAPYTQVFPQGVTYYLAAPLDEEETRYGELRLRVEQHLTDQPEVRSAALAGITTGIQDFTAATAALREAHAREAIAGTEARTAIQSFIRQMEKIYGALLVEVGKASAERFFPKQRTGRPDTDSTPVPPPV
ncbi:MAG: hypothetical protein EOO72_08530 [Myxococcaceae bacterium]|nr:MAG: hypothetical protein EOO72_08530 [Myxococcaceae bacterium]